MKGIIFFIAGVLLLNLMGGLFLLGARINTSGSLPIGLYWIIHKPIEKGDYVIFCPPNTKLFQQALKRHYLDAGFCQGGFGSMMKQVFALKGDSVSISPKGIRINHTFLPSILAYKKDGNARLLPSVFLNNYQLGENEWLFISNHSPWSFDGRYFGVLSNPTPLSVIKPILTF